MNVWYGKQWCYLRTEADIIKGCFSSPVLYSLVIEYILQNQTVGCTAWVWEMSDFSIETLWRICSFNRWKEKWIATSINKILINPGEAGLRFNTKECESMFIGRNNSFSKEQECKIQLRWLEKDGPCGFDMYSTWMRTIMGRDRALLDLATINVGSWQYTNKIQTNHAKVQRSMKEWS